MILPAPPERARAEGPHASNLTLRVASAVVLAPITLAITYWGGFAFHALCAVVAGGSLWEWVSLVSHQADARVLAPGWLAVVAAMLLVGWGWPTGSVGAVAAGALAAAAIVAVLPRSTDEAFAPAWAAGGDFDRKLARGTRDLLAGAVVERNHEREPIVVAGEVLGFLQQQANVAVEIGALADDAHAHIALVQLDQVLADEAAQ